MSLFYLTNWLCPRDPAIGELLKVLHFISLLSKELFYLTNRLCPGDPSIREFLKGGRGGGEPLLGAGGGVGGGAPPGSHLRVQPVEEGVLVLC